ncbi:MAG: class I SAM-dependent methyltransferase [Leptolyngbyaceae cyanobacterium RM2_2_4]|nr:class I SAM-dependent methyltransferase [bacterium]NJO50773.1 class I SAM-dependent methyltransferase [Leptolyngbyaceae cyanobacterium RM2_2_4]
MTFLPLSQIQKRFFAWGMAKANAADDRAIQLRDCQEYATMGDLKRSLLGNLQGTVLEIGPGAGANLSYYPTGIHWIGVEPNPFMHPYIYQEAERHGLKQIELHARMADQLSAEDHSLDTVVSTHVLCSVTNIDSTLREIQRVLKPGGAFVFIEHVAAPDGSCTRFTQDGVTPIWKTIFDGCHPNRETWMLLDNAGFELVQYQQFRLAIPIVSPHIAGIAMPRRE